MGGRWQNERQEQGRGEGKQWLQPWPQPQAEPEPQQLCCLPPPTFILILNSKMKGFPPPPPPPHVKCGKNLASESSKYSSIWDNICFLCPHKSLEIYAAIVTCCIFHKAFTNKLWQLHSFPYQALIFWSGNFVEIFDLF